MLGNRIRAKWVVVLVSAVWTLQAAAHVFPKAGETSPAPDSVHSSQPRLISIGFSGLLEPALSHVVVTDRQGRELARGGVDPDNKRTLETALPELRSGGYRVRWSIVGRDGHRTEGEFGFRVD